MATYRRLNQSGALIVQQSEEERVRSNMQKEIKQLNAGVKELTVLINQLLGFCNTMKEHKCLPELENIFSEKK